MVYVPVLEIYDSATTKVEVHTDTSAKALGAILLQKYAAAKYFQTISYYSKMFNNM